jgi:hypothetical protein
MQLYGAYSFEITNRKRYYTFLHGVFLLTGFMIGAFLIPVSDPISPFRPTTIETYFFQKDYADADMLKSGWSTPGPDGTWSIGRHSELAFALDDASANDLELLFEFLPHVPRRKAALSVNGTAVESWPVRRQDRSKSVRVPRALWDRTRPAVVSLTLSGPRSPTERGTGPANSQLGILLKAVTIRKVY